MVAEKNGNKWLGLGTSLLGLFALVTFLTGPISERRGLLVKPEVSTNLPEAVSVAVPAVVNIEDPEIRERTLAPACWTYKSKISCENASGLGGVYCFWSNAQQKCKIQTNTQVPTQTPVRVQECLGNAWQCPQFPAGQLVADYPDRFVYKDTLCFHELGIVNPTCRYLCKTLFESFNVLGWGARVSAACQVGCGYAEQWREVKGSRDCMLSCKDTVWNQGPAQACNFQKGLGIEIADLVQFGAGKACEIGCSIGNVRPCTLCDKLVAEANAG